MTLWEGRISTGMADAVAEFTVSLGFDRVLASDDLAGSRAHVKGLGKAGILTDNEVVALIDALDMVEEEFETEIFQFALGDEDVHTAIERRVTELIGDVGAKIHTGRSRNDQVATALRLWCRRSLVGVAEEIMALQDALAQRAARRPTSTFLDTPTCSGPNRCSWPTTSWPTGGPWPATSTGFSRPSTASTRRRSGRVRWPARRCRWTPTMSPPSSVSTVALRTPSMRCPTATSWPRPCSTWPSSGCTSRGWERRSCCGRRRSSGSARSTTCTPPAARCCPRRRTPMWPSSPGPNRAV